MFAQRVPCLVVLAAVVLTAGDASARFLPVQVEKVPVERLLKTLQAAVEKNPKDVQALVNLGRVHAMAYALRSEEVPVDRKRPEAGVWFGYTPPLVPFRDLAKTDDPARLKAAHAHLDEALRLYARAAELAPKELTIQLGYGWLLAQAGKKTEAIAILRKVAETAWQTEQNLEFLNLGGHTLVAEAADYLIPLLDPEKDKAEIATLKERAEKLRQLPRPVTPIAVPLRPGLNASDLEDRAAAVAFDADGSGLPRRWTWITRDAAWLVYDPKGTGRIDSALQLFGSVTFWLFWRTGYDALAALDDDGDGRLSGAELAGLALWHDANGNGVSDPGEVKPLAEYGIVALSCRWQRDDRHPDRIAYAPAGVVFRDGTTRPTFDLILRPAR